MKKFLISGTASGVGKTTITLAIEAALRCRGLVVQPFKCGPDYLDTTHHTAICGRRCRNLDTIMLSPSENLASIHRASVGADIAVAEGMMGLFDGLSGDSDHGSSAEIAKLLNLPVLLVMDASASARSLAATLLGFHTFDHDLKIAGVILNRVAGESHFRMLAEAIEGSSAIPILGWFPKSDEWTIPERHLGLYGAPETAWPAEKLSAFAEFAEQYLDIGKILDLAATQDDGFASLAQPQCASTQPKVRIGVARDEAFSFYYEDNFDLLQDYGAELVEFSPLHDPALPSNLDALYLGGGYPELHAPQLARNHSMLASVQQFCRTSRPVYAECGGMMFLAQSITTNGASSNMTGVLPLNIEMSPSLVKFGYVKVSFNRDCILGPAQTEVTGHSFHFSKIQTAAEIPTAYSLQYLYSNLTEPEGYESSNVLASYVHLHFRSNHDIPRHFIRSARSAQQKPAVLR